jgi:hypothetical protein
LTWESNSSKGEIPNISDQFFCTIFDVIIGEKIRDKYAERPETRLSLFKSMAPEGGIEPTTQARNLSYWGLFHGS